MPRDFSEPTAHPIARAGSGDAPQPIGRVDAVTGTVTTEHVDGTVVTLTQDAPVFQKDLIVTQAGANVALVFADKTTFALGEAGRLRLDELVYNPAGHDGKIALSMLKGAFAFVSGDIAGTQPEAMVVHTPAGTIGIRGTAVAGIIDPAGSRIAAVSDPSGAPSIIVFTNAGGTQVLTENTMLAVLSFFSAPGAPTAITFGALGEAGDLMAIAGTIATEVNPGGSNPAGPAGGSVAPPPGPGAAPGEGGGPVIHVTITEGAPTDVGGGPPTFQYSFTVASLDTTVPPPPPPPSHPHVDNEVPASLGGFVGVTFARNEFHGTPNADLFDFTTNHNSLKSGDFVDGGGGNDTLSATFDKPFAIDGTLTIHNVPNIHLTLGGGPSSLDGLGITGGASGRSTITVTGSGALTVTDLQVNFDGHAMTDPLSITATGGNVTIEGGQGNDTLTGAGFGSGDAVSYAQSPTAVTLNYAAGTALHGGAVDHIAGFDVIVGSALSDSIDVSLGGGQQIVVEAGGGNNTLTGSFSDFDIVSYAHAPSAVTVDFTAGMTPANGYGGTDAFSGFVGAIGSTFDDAFITTDSTRYIDGNGGQDTVLIDGANNDLTVVGAHQVTLINAADVVTDLTVVATTDFFTVDFSAGSGSDTINVAGGGGGGTILSGTGNDSVGVFGAFDSITVGDGADTVAIAGGFDTVTGGNGADLLDLSGDANAITLLGGNDVVGVTGNANSIVVGNGADAISVAGNANVLQFGSGNDTIGISGNGNFAEDSMGPFRDEIGIVGNDDTLVLSGGNNSVTLTGTGDVVSISGGDDTISVLGGSGNAVDVLGNDSIMFVGSDDSVAAGAGNDTIIIGGNVDTVVGGSGNDLITLAGTRHSISVGNGADTIRMVGAFDTVVAGGGSDSFLFSGSRGSVTAGSGADTVQINSAFDTVVTGNGNDTILASGTGHDSISVGAGSDTINVGGANVTIVAGAGAASISVSQIDELVVTGTGNDTITASFGGGDTVVVGGGGDAISLTGNGDVVSVVGGSSNLFGGGGMNDALSFAGAAAPYDVNFLAGTAASGAFSDVISGFDQVIGSNGADTIDVSGGADFVTVEGGGGNDVLTGNGLDDALSFAHATAAVVVTFTGADSGTASGGYAGGGTETFAGFDIVQPGPGADTLTGTGSQTLDYSHAGAAVTLTITGFDTILGAASGTGTGGTATGDQFAEFHALVAPATAGNALIITSAVASLSDVTLDSDGTGLGSITAAGAVAINGFSSVTYGGASGVTMRGDAFDLHGGDTLTGGSGNDTIYAGQGTEQFDGNGTGAFGDHNTLDLSNTGVGAPETVTISQLDGTRDGAVAGTVQNGASTASFAHFDQLIAYDSLAGGSSLVIAGGVIAGDTIDLNAGAITYDGGAGTISITGFTSVVNATGLGLHIDGTGAGDTLTGGSGGSTLTAGAAGIDDFNYLATTDSFSAAGNAPDGHTSVIAGFSDSASTIDFTNLAGAGTETVAGSTGTFAPGTPFATAFAGGAAGIVDYAVIGSDTFVHVHSGVGYSVGDLLIDIQGIHAPTIHAHA